MSIFIFLSPVVDILYILFISILVAKLLYNLKSICVFSSLFKIEGRFLVNLFLKIHMITEHLTLKRIISVFFAIYHTICLAFIFISFATYGCCHPGFSLYYEMYFILFIKQNLQKKIVAIFG